MQLKEEVVLAGALNRWGGEGGGGSWSRTTRLHLRICGSLWSYTAWNERTKILIIYDSTGVIIADRGVRQHITIIQGPYGGKVIIQPFKILCLLKMNFVDPPGFPPRIILMLFCFSQLFPS